MIDKQTFGLISLAISTVGYGSYIKSILDRRTRPHIFSWGVWGAVMTLIFLAQLSAGAAAGAWVTGYSAAACLVIALFSLTRGEKSITRSDWVAFTGACLTIPVWYLTKDPLWVVVIGSLIDAFAYYPTFRKSYIKPYEEHSFTYTMDTLKWVVALFALGNYTLTTLLYPLFLIMANSMLVGMIVWRRRRRFEPT